MSYSIDSRAVYATAAAVVGDDFRVTVGLLDTVIGAVDSSGGTITATLGGTSLTVDSSTAGLFVCSLTEAQTTSLGAGQHALLFRLAPAVGDTRTYVAGTVTLSSAATTAGGSVGYQVGIVGSVFVVVF